VAGGRARGRTAHRAGRGAPVSASSAQSAPDEHGKAAPHAGPVCGRVDRREDRKGGELEAAATASNAESTGRQGGDGSRAGGDTGPPQNGQCDQRTDGIEGNDDREECRLMPTVAVEKDKPAVIRVADKGLKCRSRGIVAGEERRDVDPLALGDPADEGRVVVRPSWICVTATKHPERLDHERSRREEAGGSLRIAIEVVTTEARRSWAPEVLGPGELREELPERPERIAVSDDLDMRSPDALTCVET